MLSQFYFFLAVMALVTGRAIPSMIANRNTVSQSTALCPCKIRFHR